MKKLRRLFNVFVLCLCVLVSGMMIPTISYAKETEKQVEPRMTYISIYKTELSISSSGVATVTGEVRGKTGVTSTYVKVILQKYVSGRWIDVEDWSDSQSGRSAFVSETYQVGRGTYRTYMTCSANTETKTTTSAERTY